MLQHTYNDESIFAAGNGLEFNIPQNKNKIALEPVMSWQLNALTGSLTCEEQRVHSCRQPL